MFFKKLKISVCCMILFYCDRVPGANMIEENIKIKSVTPKELMEVDFKRVTLLDLRDYDEITDGKLEGAIHIPLNRISRELSTVPKDKAVYAYCASGIWSREITEILMERGYEVYNLEGGYKAYKEYMDSFVQDGDKEE